MATRSAIVSVTTTAASTTIDGPAAGILVTNLDGVGYVSGRLSTTADVTAAEQTFYLAATAGAQRAIRISKWPISLSLDASATTTVAIECVEE